ncbi:hypothetical protein L1987_30306 [Smallanthus sonchifolius]|uniref:Uncharacterized protein n=1 Tax=Smallanthus sonchifolius TaxID=185202 RepID=A0ACB9I337_9ASTR|nr:hypothetical protein L1987_30306 [Smallanthus sonchifolius]
MKAPRGRLIGDSYDAIDMTTPWTLARSEQRGGRASMEYAHERKKFRGDQCSFSQAPKDHQGGAEVIPLWVDCGLELGEHRRMTIKRKRFGSGGDHGKQAEDGMMVTPDCGGGHERIRRHGGGAEMSDGSRWGARVVW